MNSTPFASPDIARLLTLFARLVAANGCKAITANNIGEFAAAPGEAVLFFAEDPKRFPEVWDVAVVLPDILRSAGRAPSDVHDGAPVSADRLRVGLLDPLVARMFAAEYGVTIWPTLVFLRDGQRIGAIERMRDWDEYAERIAGLLHQPTHNHLTEPTLAPSLAPFASAAAGPQAKDAS